MEVNSLYGVIVVGGGPAGLAAAVTLSRGGKKVLLLEKYKNTGRKILLSGNGRCNITNTLAAPDKYYGDKKFIQNFLSLFSFNDCKKFLLSLGVVIEEEADGRCFPVTGKAESVKRAFELALKETGAAIITEAEAADFKKQKDFFEVKLKDGRVFTSEYLVLACGGAANAGENAYSPAKNFGHTVTPLLPAMAALELIGTEALHGVRLNAAVSLDGRTETGEIIFTNSTLSGLPVLSLSRNAERGAEIKINFFPQFEKTEFAKYIKERAAAFQDRKLEDFFAGLLPDGLALYLLQYLKLPKTVLAGRADSAKISSTLQNFPFEIKGIKGFAQAMSTRGGVPLGELKQNFSSKNVKKLFIIGETADIDAVCGGYSLHLAFASGVISAKSILAD